MKIEGFKQFDSSHKYNIPEPGSSYILNYFISVAVKLSK